MIRNPVAKISLLLFLTLGGCSASSGITTIPAVAIASYDTAQKADRLRERAKNGDVYAMHMLGDRLCCGESTTLYDNAEAFHWYCTAARRSFVKSQMALARLYDPQESPPAGPLPPKDALLSTMWYSLAARQGNLEAIAARNRTADTLTEKERASITPLMNHWRTMPCGLAEDTAATEDATSTERRRTSRP